jgi:hypothetical protein
VALAGGAEALEVAPEQEVPGRAVAAGLEPALVRLQG